MDTFTVEHDSVLPHFEVVGAIKMQNKCCFNKPVLITKTNGCNVYSCQCSCGGWCTNGHEKISEAISDYERMNNGENLYFTKGYTI